VIGAATAYALEQRRKRKEEEAREQAKAREEVARRNAEREAAKVRNWLAAEAARKEAALTAASAHTPNPRTGVDPETADVTEAERLAEYKKTPEYQKYQRRLEEWEMQQTERQPRSSQPTTTPTPFATPIPTRVATPTAVAGAVPGATPNPNIPAMTGVVTVNWPPALRSLDQFHQNQGSVPVTGDVECVTTTIVTNRNVMNELLAYRTGHVPLPNLLVQDYTAKLDKAGMLSLPYRFPTNFPDIKIPFTDIKFNPRGFMLPRWQAKNALEQFAGEFKAYYGCSFTVKQTSGNTIPDIARNLQQGNFVLISGMNAPSPNDLGQQFLGGNPHTFGTVKEVDFTGAGTITLIDTGGAPTSTYSFQEFLDFWGRKSWINIYSKPNTMTALIPDVCPVPQATPQITPQPTPPIQTPSNTPSSSTAPLSGTPTPPPAEIPK
jgi:hypothetical protein